MQSHRPRLIAPVPVPDGDASSDSRKRFMNEQLDGFGRKNPLDDRYELLGGTQRRSGGVLFYVLPCFNPKTKPYNADLLYLATAHFSAVRTHACHQWLGGAVTQFMSLRRMHSMSFAYISRAHRTDSLLFSTCFGAVGTDTPYKYITWNQQYCSGAEWSTGCIQQFMNATNTTFSYLTAVKCRALTVLLSMQGRALYSLLEAGTSKAPTHAQSNFLLRARVTTKKCECIRSALQHCKSSCRACCSMCQTRSTLFKIPGAIECPPTL